MGVFWKTLVLAALLGWALAHPSYAYLKSAYLGGWPGICEDGTCIDDGTPLATPFPYIRRNILEHQLRSPTCPTDLVYITLEYPQNTGSPDLDTFLATRMAQKFREARDRALDLSCNDFDGCEGHCLPVGIESHYYLHQPSKNFLSIFQVERFIGNFRRNVHIRGTVKYIFENYSLITGKPLTLKDIFVDPRKSTPAFWKKINELLERSSNCQARDLLVSNRPAGRDLKENDFLLSEKGLTVALWTDKKKKNNCLSQALDLSYPELLELGLNPAILGR
ncbi:MAG: hypothetical protein LBF22_14115 [Deltaproteobacteria bacterium]|nr:hypothetical protein [Deltaproteobacteria bacterium]